MTTEKPPSAFARAEAGSRQVVLQIGLGVAAFVLGSILSVGASARIGERLGPIQSDAGALIFRWTFERMWLVAVMPLFGYAIGRFTELKASRFALTAIISGETFAVLLVTAINGLDYFLEDTPGLVARAVSLFLGMVLTVRAVEAGREAAAEGQVEADAIAAKRKAEYAEFLAAAEGKGAPVAPPAVENPTGPLPRGGDGDSSEK